MQIQNQELIRDLRMRTQQLIERINRFKSLPHDTLNYKITPDRWSILECIEHLNRYGDFYLPAIEKSILENPRLERSPAFRSGVLGNYFGQMMLPKNGKIKSMKTFPDMDPANSTLSATTINRFVKQQNLLLDLLQAAEFVNLTKAKTPVSFTRLLHLRLGDTLRFVVYHNERHVRQAEKVLEAGSYGGFNRQILEIRP